MRADAQAGGGRGERLAIVAGAAVILAVTLAIGIAALLGTEQRTLERDALVLLPIVLLVAAAALVALWRARARAARARAAADAALLEAVQARAQERERRERERAEHQRELRARDVALGRERELNARLQQSRRAEREWNRELRAQIHRLQQEHGVLAGSQDVRALVLRAAIELVGAQKGILISRTDEDGDGDLDLVLAHGFEHDPEESAVAQRFARQVLDRDEIVREDQPHEGERALTPADREIDAIAAIPLYLRDRFDGVVVCANRPGGFEQVDDDLLLALGDHAGAALQSAQLRNELRDSHRAALRMLTEALAARDPLLAQGSAEIAVLAIGIARDLGLDERQRDVLVAAALLRDAGYLALSDTVLLKPGPLSAEERAVIELHPRIGFNIVRQLPALRDVAFTLLYHHERWDGQGYPAGLAGDGSPFLSRALAVLDAYGAMTNDRPYREALPGPEAVAQLVAGAGTQFDPEITQLFVEHVRRAPPPPAPLMADALVEALPLAGGGTPGVLGELSAPAVDGLTLLGNHRAMLEEAERQAAERATPEHPFAVVLLQLDELARVNEEASYLAGDRLIQAAARHAQRAAARFGATAYRESGRRIGVLADMGDGRRPEELLQAVQTEFLGGPSVRAALAVWQPGETGSQVVARARSALQSASSSRR